MGQFDQYYYQDSYQKEFQATVTNIQLEKDGYWITLSKTTFYPEGGGQYSDRGTINGYEVLDVQLINDEVCHFVKHEFKVGETVEGSIDWQYRFDAMQNHTGEHIVSGLVSKHYGYDNVGFHMGELIQIDFNGPLTFEDCRKLENEANEVIYRNIPVIATYPSQEEREQMSYRSKKALSGIVRIITIEGVDECACCGTHTRSTAEVGLIRLLSCQKHKNGTRIQMLSGRKALVYDQTIFDENVKISQRCSAKMIETSKAVEGLFRMLEQQRQRSLEIIQQLFDLKLDTYKNDANIIIDFEQHATREMMLKMANELIAKKHAKIAVVLNQEEDGYAYCILSHEVSLRQYSKLLNESLHGKGGGKDEILQGNFHTVKEDIVDVLLQVFENME